MLLLLLLQAIQVAILWAHDWVPLGGLNDVTAVRPHDTRNRLVKVTLVQSVPFTIGLIATIVYVQTGHPLWLWTWLWISYGVLFVGELRAWWWPYLIWPEPQRAERYQAMFGRTSAFLPIRNGIVPNALHTILHVSTVGTLIMLCLLTRGS